MRFSRQCGRGLLSSVLRNVGTLEDEVLMFITHRSDDICQKNGELFLRLDEISLWFEPFRAGYT